uniref:Putative prefoldin subunit 2 n=1 Tax=Amblyomma cajennense TaxID=34607 RepID=A0A023FGW7_AMBCJ
MAAEGEKKSSKKDEMKRQAQEQSVVDGFNQLRQEQRALTAKLVELEMELNEHNLVAEALQKVDGDRRCYRMVGGVLVERTVKDILPAVERNRENLSKSVEMMNEKIVQKGQEVNEYREKHNIQIRVSGPPKPQPAAAGNSGEGEKSAAAQPTTGVLV